MSVNLSFDEVTLSRHPAKHPPKERRSKQRITNPFPALVRGVTANGKPFEVRTILDNLSRGGLYLRLAERLKPGSKLSIAIQFSNSLNNEAHALRALVHGEVLRVEPQPSGVYGVAVVFERYRLF